MVDQQISWGSLRCVGLKFASAEKLLIKSQTVRFILFLLGTPLHINRAVPFWKRDPQVLA